MVVAVGKGVYLLETLSHVIVVLVLQGTGSTAVMPSRASAQPTVHVMPEER